MKESSVHLKSNLKKIDAHQIGTSDYDDIPVLPEEFFTEGQPYRHGKPVARRPRGKQKKPIKKQLTLRLNPEVVEFFKAQGDGWQSNIDKALVEYVRAHKTTVKSA